MPTERNQERTVRLRGIKCACGERELVSVQTGSAPVKAPGGILIDTGEPMIGYCVVCAPWLRGYRPDRIVGAAEA